jgi:hypothetical protein
MKNTITQLQKQARLAPKYVLHTNEFGYDIYIAGDTSIITDKIEEAVQYSVGFDNKEVKLGYWKAVTGYDLKVVQIKIN